MAGYISFLIIVTFNVLFVRAGDTTTTCFGFNGLAYPDNVVCPGSQACCGATATCLSNRLCHNEGDNNLTFVRGPCAVDPYDIDTCAQVCVYNETTASKGILPRVTVCENGSFCCNSDPSCCGDSTGVFLNDEGLIVASPTTTSSITSSTAFLTSLVSSSNLVSSATITPISSSTASTNNSSATASASVSLSVSTIKTVSPGLTDAAKVGFGVGTPLVLIIVGGVVAIIWSQHRRTARAKQKQAEDRTPSQPRYTNEAKLHWARQPPGSFCEMDVQDAKTISELPAERSV